MELKDKVGKWYLYDKKEKTNYIAYHRIDERDCLIIKKWEDDPYWRISISIKDSGDMEVWKKTKSFQNAKKIAYNYMANDKGKENNSLLTSS